MKSKQSIRAASWWISWRELEWPTVDSMDAICRRADEFAGAGVDTAMVFGCHFRWDFMPWWGMLHDYLAHVREELNQRGIRLFDHHSAVLTHRYENAEQMRHIMMHQGSHLPVCPDRQSAASWTYNGQLLNSWRMYDVTTGQPLWLEFYDAESYCPANPNFIESYCKYVKQLLKETGIDGLMCDDVAFSKPFCTCSCPSCRERFHKLSGLAFPDTIYNSFWGNLVNPVWRDYVDDRFNVITEFYAHVRAVLPSRDYPMLACCSGSCMDFTLSCALDLAVQLKDGNCNIANLEIVGNTPPGPMDHNTKFTDRMVQAAYHIGVADEHDAPVLAIAYGFIEDNAKAGWSLVKSLGGNLWFSTLPYRLGLSRKRLDALPGHALPAAKAFTFEKAHPELFNGELFNRCTLFFSHNTRNHTAFGSMVHGLTSDFCKALALFLEAGMIPKVVTAIPTEPFGPLVLPDVALLNDEERTAIEAFIAKGGKVVAFGPCGWRDCSAGWTAPMRPTGDIFRSPDEWMTVWGGSVPPVPGSHGWREISKGFFYNPARLDDGTLSTESLLAHVTPLLPSIPGVNSLANDGFFATAHLLHDGRTLLFFVAMDYDVQLDEALEAERQHRTRVNIMRQAPPRGQSGNIFIALADNWRLANVILPFNECTPEYDEAGRIKLSAQVNVVLAELVH
ncbi:MAG: hypothetical protein IKR81_09285 [Victivallales bacterium]|nr:hypothetical protein [Victivallales bacterium]